MILEQTDKHALQIQRFATKLFNEGYYKTLLDAYKAVRLALLDLGDINAKAKLNSAEKAVNEAIKNILMVGYLESSAELGEFAVYEAAFIAGLMSKATDYDFSVPARERIISYVDSALMSLEAGGKVSTATWAEFLDNQAQSVKQAYIGSIRASYLQGESVNQAVNRLRTQTNGLLKHQLEALVRTGAQHYANQAREAMYNDNANVIEYFVYTATLDNRTSTLCAGRDGNKYKKGEPRPTLPAHFNCLSGDTNVSTCSDVSRVYKRAYKGVMVNIKTRSGRSIKITPNHPILTGRGWVSASDINLLDKVVTIKDVVGFSGENYKNNVVSKFSDLFSSVYVFGDSNSIGVAPTTTKDFHGDVTHAEVSVVNTDCFGWSNFAKATRESFEDQFFPFGSSVDSSFNCLSSLFPLGYRALSSSRCLVSASNKSGLFGSATPIHSGLLLLSSISCLNAKFRKNPFYKICRDIHANMFTNSRSANSRVESIKDLSFLGITDKRGSSIDKLYTSGLNHSTYGGSRKSSDITYLGSGDTRFSKLDDVIYVGRFYFNGHVYNLENYDNWYTSNGIVTHNCRSTYLPLVKGEDSLEGKRPAVGGQEGQEAKEKFEARQDKTDKKVKYKGRKDSSIFDVEQIKATTKYESWLKQQPRWFVESALGKTRAALFLDGKLSIKKFNDMTGRQLTLAELRLLDKRAFEEAGI